MTYSFSEAVVAMIWMAWVLTIGITEAVIHIWYPNIHLIIEEDEWAVRILR